MIYGYVRVSTKEQHTDRQMEALGRMGIPRRNIYVDKRSGKDFERPAYRRMMRRLKKNDVLVVKSIDRLGRNYEEILYQWRIITKEKQSHIVVIDMPLLDTRVKENGVTGVFIADLVLQILAYVAQTERDFIRSRQREGIDAAKARGVRFGRPRLMKPENFPEVYECWKTMRISGREGARQLHVDLKTFRTWIQEEEMRMK